MDWIHDVVILSRIQFAFTIMFHYLYPPLSIGLGLLLVLMEGMYLWTKNPVYERMTKFWVRIFALNFSLGVATGIVMEFEFGTNWATYSRFVGDIFGSALAAEGIFAFFLESGFVAVLIFGWDRVSPKMHFFSTIMVSLGSIFSSVWIVIANNWQQIPVGYHIVDAAGNVLAKEGEPFIYNPLNTAIQPRAEITDFWAMVLSTSSVTRISHTVVGAFILGAFFVMSISAWYILKNRHLDFAKRSFTIALIFGTVCSLSQLLLGHTSAEIVAEKQPAKLAAFEGVFRTEPNTDAYLFGWPNAKEERIDYGIAVPGMLSFLVHGNFQDPVTGLDKFEQKDRPGIHIPFQTYHIMIALGMYFIGITLFSCFLLWRGKLFEQRWLLWVFVFSVVTPYIANQAGWVAAETGRQPWIVYGLLRTSDGVSKAIGAQSVIASLIMFTLIYILLFAMFIYLLDRKIKHGPDEDTPHVSQQTGPGELKELIVEHGPTRKHLAAPEEEDGAR
ncbi:cytochrome ubiquinol oxidase subunit I [Candidatus Sumerlaeota bacterium]|nr:cytochrome ubiquinol oxidase subunit I [Candidatus Sumerlaeota bacterium]